MRLGALSVQTLLAAEDHTLFLEREEIDPEIERLHFETKVFLELESA
jgi:hypothetical protein